MLNIIAPIVLIASSTHAQVYNPVPHTTRFQCFGEHDSQLPPLSDWTCAHQGTAYNVAIYEPVVEMRDETAFETTLVGECAEWECGNPPAIILADCGYTQSNQTCWSSQGNVKVEIKWALLARLGPEFEFGGELSDCNGDTFSAGIQGSINHCTERDCIISTITVIKSTSVKVYDEVKDWVCVETDTGLILELGTTCGEKSGNANMNTEVRKRIWFGLERPNLECDPCGPTCFIYTNLSLGGEEC